MFKQSKVKIGLALLGLLPAGGLCAATSIPGPLTTISGEQKQWHKVTLTFAGPTASETGSPNPFRNYRLDVTFKHTASGQTYVVPGYFAADGNAANTSATSGNKWRVHFAPDATGTWTYVASFRTGTDVAASTSLTAGSATSFNGEKGSFTIDASNKSGADFRAKGRLEDVGQHYFQFKGNKEYFVKVGAGSPENFLAYADFDNTTAGNRILHRYAPHVTHYRSGDPTWKGGKGKAIIGAVTYLASKKMNSLYFLTMNVNGDGNDVFPWTTKSERYRFDVSKLAQWEIVFEHMQELGIHLHMVTQEQENDQLLDSGNLGLQRKLYYRELIARFGHHLALTWNLGEENTNTSAQRSAFSNYINGVDPYLHPIALHTFPNQRDAIYTAELGDELIGAASLQLETPSIVHAETLKWVKKSAASGRKWVVAVDELGKAAVGVVPDANDPEHAEIMKRVLWGGFLAGAAGMEWYFGYDYANDDLDCEDWTSRERMWELSAIAAQFMRDHVPLPLVANYNSLTSTTSDYVLGKPGSVYVIYLPAGVATDIALPAGETYAVNWFDPRRGGSLVAGTVTSVTGGSAVALGRPSGTTGGDWVALLRRSAEAPAGEAPKPAPEPETGMAVSKLTLIDATRQLTLGALSNATIVSLATTSAINVLAETSGKVGSVLFYVDGKLVQRENLAPYALAGDDSGVFRKWQPTVGTHTVRAVPYSGSNGSGAVGTPVEVTFSVVASTDVVTAPVEDVVKAPAAELAVTRFVLIDAATQRDLRELTDGAVIRLSQDGTALNIRAEVAGSAGCVLFVWDGKNYCTENLAPYAIGLDDNGVYRRWTPPLGSHTLRGVPYSGSNRSGNAGTARTIRIDVVN